MWNKKVERNCHFSLFEEKASREEHNNTHMHSSVEIDDAWKLMVIGLFFAAFFHGWSPHHTPPAGARFALLVHSSRESNRWYKTLYDLREKYSTVCLAF